MIFGKREMLLSLLTGALVRYGVKGGEFGLVLPVG